MVARLDIGYAVMLLSQYSSAPQADHYHALKQVCRYLRQTKDWGIVYWRTAPVDSLPEVALDQPTIDPSLPEYPQVLPRQLAGYVDAAHATDLKTRRSITGLVFTFASSAIAFKSKLQPTVATSSTECEFIAAVHAAKIAKYLRTVLADLEFAQPSPTPLFEDNQATIAMIQKKPLTGPATLMFNGLPSKNGVQGISSR